MLALIRALRNTFQSNERNSDPAEAKEATLMQITSPEGAVSLVNTAFIKSIVPFSNGAGCNIHMIGDAEGKALKVGVSYERVLAGLKAAGISIVYP